MADAVVRLKVESQEYENKLARATQQLQHMEKEVRRTGASFEFADKEELAFIQSLGQMETKTQSVRSKMREYTESILSLSEMYERLSDTEKNSDFGRGLLSSIDQIKQRAGELKDNIGDLDAEIKHLASDTSTFDSLAGGVNLMVSAFQVGQGIIQMFGVENENAVKAIAKLQGAMAVTNGLVQLQNALQKESAVMLGVTTLQRKAAAAAAAIEAAAVGKGTVALKAATAAQKALNLAAKANPYVLLATAVVAVGAALWKMSKNSEAAKRAEEAHNRAMEKAEESFKNYNDTMGKSVGGIIASYKLLKSEWETLSTDAEKTTWIDNQKSAFDQLGISVKTISEAENVFVRNTDKMVKALTLRAQASALEKLAAQEYEAYYAGMQEQGGVVTAGQQADWTEAFLLNQYDQALRENWAQMPQMPANYQYMQKNSDGNWAYTEWGAEQENLRRAEAAGVSLGTGDSYIGMLGDIRSQAEQLFREIGVQPTVAPTTPTTPTTPSGDATDTEKVKTAADMWNELSEKIAEAERLLGEFQAMAANTELSEEQRNWATDMVKKYEEEIKKLKNTKEVIPIQFSDKGINELKNKIKEALGGEIFGSDGYALQATKIVDVTTLENLLNTALTNGLNVDMTYLSGLFESIKLDADIDDATWDALVAEINTQLEALDLPKIKLDVTTGNITNVAKDAAKATDEWQQAVSAVGQLGGALQGLEDPSAKVAGIIAQAIANIALTFATSLKGTVTPWDWIAAAISGTATMIGTISAIKSATSGSYADGGIIPGNSFSGDNLTASVNSGELILNRAQQNTIASQLQGGATQNMRLEALISGESLRMVLANNASRRGGNRAQYAISKFG